MGKHSLAVIFTLIISLSAISAQAQETAEIKGLVLREDSLTPIYGAVIYNKNSLLGTISNKVGNFKMRIKPGDTLQISHLGFVTHLVIFDHIDFDPNEKIRVVMKIRSYELPGIDVKRFRIREKPLKPFTLRRTDNITYDMGQFRVDDKAPYYFPGNNRPGVSFGLPLLGVGIPDFQAIKRQKQYAKIAELEKKDEVKKYIRYKYNKRLINQLTGLTGNELENFMNFCKPTDKQVIEANDYDMAYFILDCYEKFREEND